MSGRRRFIPYFVSIMFLILISPNQSFGLDTDVIDGVVTIQTDKSIGAGFSIDPNEIITAAHVVLDAEEIQIVLQSDIKVLRPARIKFIDESTDVAILEVDTTGIPKFAVASSPPEINQEVFAIGSPIGAPVLSKGEYKGLSPEGFLTANVPVDSGNSGGPLLDEFGNVIGIVQAVQFASTKLLLAGSTKVISDARNGISQKSVNPAILVVNIFKADWLSFVIIFGVLAFAIVLIAVSSRRKKRLPKISISEADLKWWK